MKEDIREQMKAELGKTLRVIAIQARENMNMTQSQFADALVMSLRSYQKIEGGKCDCGALTAFLLIAHQSNRQMIFEEVCEKLLTIYEGDMYL